MTEDLTEVNSWHRQPGESAKAYEAFAFYRDMGPERSLLKVCQSIPKMPVC